jgi:bla regulator protein BlaR1
MTDAGLFSLGTFWGSEVANHLWQSTLFAAAAWLLTIFLRRNRARVRYWIWVAVSVKFLIPFSLLVSLGGLIDIGRMPTTGLTSSESPEEWIIIKNINQPFSTPASIKSSPADVNAGSDRSTLIPVSVFGAWVFGIIGCLFCWMKKGREVSRVIRESKPLSHGPAFAALLRLKQSGRIPDHIRLASSKTSIEPGVFGIFRPVLLLPDGMTQRLESSELEAILEHELSHIRCRDNLVAAFHMFVEALFWFHPMVWWIGSRLVHEREKACDEAVLQSGKEPQAYAEGILKVCEFYLESPLACVSGVIGSNLKKRIEEIMKQRIGYKLSTAKKLILLGTCFLALTTPLLIGALTARSGLSQSNEGTKPSFDVASIKPIDDCREKISSEGGGIIFHTRSHIPTGAVYGMPVIERLSFQSLSN